MAQATVNVYPLESYKIGQKEERSEKDPSSAARFERMEATYELEGIRRCVDGVLLVHQHKHPHVLLLQVTLSKQQGGGTSYRLPGGRIKPGETEKAGLLRKLSSKMAPTDQRVNDMKWEIGQELSTWWRPSYTDDVYPYLPVHVTRPKECRKLYLVHLPEHSTFAIAKNRNLVAVPLYELYDNHQHYGPVIAAIPLAIARLTCICSEPEVALVKPAPTPTTTPAKKQKTSDSASQQTDDRPKPGGVGGAGEEWEAEEGGQGRAGDSEGGGKEGGGEDS